MEGSPPSIWSSASVVRKILSKLWSYDVVSFSEVSKRCYEISSDPLLWKILFQYELNGVRFPNEGKEVTTLQRRNKWKEAFSFVIKSKRVFPTTNDDPFVQAELDHKKALFQVFHSKLLTRIEDSEIDDPDIISFQLSTTQIVLPVKAKKSIQVSQLIKAWSESTDNKNPASSIRLMLSNQEMDPEKTLGDYEILKGQNVRVGLLQSPQTVVYI